MREKRRGRGEGEGLGPSQQFVWIIVCGGKRYTSHHPNPQSLRILE